MFICFIRAYNLYKKKIDFDINPHHGILTMKRQRESDEEIVVYKRTRQHIFHESYFSKIVDHNTTIEESIPTNWKNLIADGETEIFSHIIDEAEAIMELEQEYFVDKNELLLVLLIVQYKSNSQRKVFDFLNDIITKCRISIENIDVNNKTIYDILNQISIEDLQYYGI